MPNMMPPSVESADHQNRRILSTFLRPDSLKHTTAIFCTAVPVWRTGPGAAAGDPLRCLQPKAPMASEFCEGLSGRNASEGIEAEEELEPVLAHFSTHQTYWKVDAGCAHPQPMNSSRWKHVG